jgi:hypothetical protein
MFPFPHFGRAMAFAAATLLATAAAGAWAQDRAATSGTSGDAARIAKGFEIAPVPLKLKGLDRNLVGLGSYIVNAQGGCNDCHTYPSYAPGGDPFKGEPTKINKQRYLAGGRPFGRGIVSANITPDAKGLPHGLTYREFVRIIRTGREPHDPDEILQVMPWPIFMNMNDRDLRAIYEYLRAIPSIRR